MIYEVDPPVIERDPWRYNDHYAIVPLSWKAAISLDIDFELFIVYLHPNIKKGVNFHIYKSPHQGIVTEESIEKGDSNERGILNIRLSSEVLVPINAVSLAYVSNEGCINHIRYSNRFFETPLVTSDYLKIDMRNRKFKNSI